MAFKIDREAWYTGDETAELRGVSKKTLEAERSVGGGIPFSRIGKRVFYRGADIEEFLLGRRQISTAQRPVNPGPNPRRKADTEQARGVKL